MLAVMMVSGCSGTFQGMPREEVLAYQASPTYGSLHAMAIAYAEAINSAIHEDTLHPGMYADYGVALALMGHEEEACRLFSSEEATFPQSAQMVERVRRQLIPAAKACPPLNPKDTINIAEVESWIYPPQVAKQLVVGAASVVDSTDRDWIARQTPTDSVAQTLRLTANQKREALEREQRRVEIAKKEYADSVAAAKQAMIDERKQAAKDKEQLKKDKAKQKKVLDKQKKQQQKECQKQREAEAKAKQKQKAAEAKAKQEQKAAEAKAKQEQKAAEAKAKQEQKAAEAKAKQEQKKIETAAKKKAKTEKKKGGEE